jgi:arylsulfatase A-like enzyme
MRMNEITADDLREIVAVYYGMITKADANLGRIIDALKESGAWDNTVVVATSDHGDFAGDYHLTEKAQNTFQDVLVNVPLAVRAPGCPALPAPSDALVEWIDLLPTLAEACGIELGHTHFGRSLLPLLRGETAEHREYVFSEGGALADEPHTHETDRPRDEMYWARVALQITEPEVHGKAAMIRSKDWKYVRRLYDTDETYDLRNDPDEVSNLIADPSASAVRDELAAAMAAWFLETGDQVPWRWDLRHPRERHPEWSADAGKHGFARGEPPS